MIEDVFHASKTIAIVLMSCLTIWSIFCQYVWQTEVDYSLYILDVPCLIGYIWFGPYVDMK